MPTDSHGPYDEMFATLAKILGDLVKNIPDRNNAHIIGCCTLIAAIHPKKEMDEENETDDEIHHEMIESDENLFITTNIPGGVPEETAYATLQRDSVTITIGELSKTIPISLPIDVIQSSIRVHRGIMDITLRKEKEQEPSE